MTAARFDELIHPPTRLAIVSLLAASQWADYKFIRDSIGLSDSALSRQLATLEQALRRDPQRVRGQAAAYLSAAHASRAHRLRTARGGAAKWPLVPRPSGRW